MAANETVIPNQKELDILRENFHRVFILTIHLT